jgi:hypothetical protein
MEDALVLPEGLCGSVSKSWSLGSAVTRGPRQGASLLRTTPLYCTGPKAAFVEHWAEDVTALPADLRDFAEQRFLFTYDSGWR